MNKKIIGLGAVLSLAALSPAPINDISAKGHLLPLHSQAQRAQEQRYNGNLPVVGTVPIKTNDQGTAPAAPPNDQEAAKNLMAVTPLVNDEKAVENLKRANAVVLKNEQKGQFPWMNVLLFFAALGGILQGGRYWLEKFGPSRSNMKFS